MEMSFLGFADRGRPPLLTLPRASMSSVSSGSSSYSCRRIICASTRRRSEPKERRDARFLAVIGFPHTEDVAIRATRCVAYDDNAAVEQTEADNADFAVASAIVLDLERRAREDEIRVVEVESALCQSSYPLRWVIRD
jgi:hypothetical protein